MFKKKVMAVVGEGIIGAIEVIGTRNKKHVHVLESIPQGSRRHRAGLEGQTIQVAALFISSTWTNNFIDTC